MELNSSAGRDNEALCRLRTIQGDVQDKPETWNTLQVETRVQLLALAQFDSNRQDLLDNKLSCAGIDIEARGCDEDLAFPAAAGAAGAGDATEHQQKPKSYPILPELVRQINAPKESALSGQSSFVVLGDSGSGKSTLAIRLCQAFWDHLDEWGRIPVCIFLPNYGTVKELLKHFFDDRLDDGSLDEVKRLSFLLVLDSFDELPDSEKELNIAAAQLRPTEGEGNDEDGGRRNFGWGGAPGQFRDVNVVTFSRKQRLDPERRSILFDFHKDGTSEGHSVLFMAPFSPDDIWMYVKQFAARLKATDLDPGLNSVLQMVKRHTANRDWENWAEEENPNTFLRWFGVLPDLFQLASTPLLLTLILAVMPEMLNPLEDNPRDPTHSGRLSELRRLCRSRTGIYDLFTDNWFRFQSERHEYSGSHPDLVRDVTREERVLLFRLYSQNLAHWFLHKGSFKNSLPLHETEHWTLLDTYQGNEQLKEACERITSWLVGTANKKERAVDTDSTSIALPELVRDVLPCRPDPHQRNTRRQESKLRNLRAIRDGCLLQFSATDCKFIHRSLVIYFESRQLSESMELLFQLYLRNEVASIDGQTSDLLFTKQLTNADILSELAARVTLRERFDEVLLEVVRASRRLPSLATFASNAITILNLGGRSLSGLDLSRVLIPGANLNHAILASTDLRGADLEGAYMESALVSGPVARR